MLRLPAFAKFSAGLALSLACSSGEEMAPSVGIFVVTASGTAAPIVLGTAARAGDPSLFKLGFYRLYMSSATDCSGPNLLHNYGTRTDFDLLTSPTLFSLTGAPVGTYPCLIMRISDILEFVPVADDGPCAPPRRAEHRQFIIPLSTTSNDRNHQGIGLPSVTIRRRWHGD